MTPERMAVARQARHPSGVGRVLALVACDTTRRIAEVLHFHADGLNTVSVARRLGLTSAVVAEHVGRLRAAGLVASDHTAVGRVRSWHRLTAAGRRTVDAIAAIDTSGTA